ncbi:MAG: phosphatidylglycerophosphatase A [Candidatus Methylomirabilales bacterium]
MDDQFSHKFVLLIATGGYVGYLPWAPGTFGSFVGLLLLWPLESGTAQVLVMLMLIGVGIFVAGRAAAIMGAQDPSAIVIDEIAGIALATMLLPNHLLERAGAFVLFRLFDVTKPPPARWAERLPGGIGIVADDLVAGLYANVLVQLWLHLS